MDLFEDQQKEQVLNVNQEGQAATSFTHDESSSSLGAASMNLKFDGLCACKRTFAPTSFESRQHELGINARRHHLEVIGQHDMEF